MGDEHAELADTVIELLNADGPHHPTADPRHRDLVGGDHLLDLDGGGTSGAIDPQPGFRGGVDLVHQVGDLPHEPGVRGRRCRKHPDARLRWGV
jgi:hypothetical protein